MLTVPIAAIVGTAGARGTPPTPELICVGETIRMRTTDPSTVSFNPVLNDVTNDGATVDIVSLDPLAATVGTVGRTGNVVTFTKAPGYAGTFDLIYHARSSTGAEADGIISFIVDGTTSVDFVTGVADTLDIEIGATTRDFDVLANDTGSGPIEITPGSIVQPTGGPTLSIVGGMLRVTRNSAAIGSYAGGSYRPRLVSGAVTASPVALTVRVVSATVVAPDFTVVVPITAASPFPIDALARCSGSGPIELHPTGLIAPTGASDTAAIVSGKINYTRGTTPVGVYTMGYKARLVATPSIEDAGTITIRVIANWHQGRPRRGGRAWATGYREMGASAATWIANNGNADVYCGVIARPGTSDTTWEGIWGGLDSEAPTAVTVQASSQLDWSTGDFGTHARALPIDGAFLLAECELFPASYQPASATDLRIWDLIDGGTLDAGYLRMGARLRKNLLALGWWDLDRFVLVPCPGMNVAGVIGRVFSATRTRHKTAMQRVYAKLREGFGSRLRIAHVVGRKAHLGGTDLSDWIPSNAAGGVDAVGLNFDPSALVTNEATFDKYLSGWDSASYGMIDDVLRAAATLSVPVIVPRWAPLARVTAGENPCPVADVVAQQFSKFLRAQAAAGNLVCDCMSGPELLNSTGYAGTDTAGIAAWTRMVADIRAIWKGTPLSPIPSLTLVATSVTMVDGDNQEDANPLAAATGSESVGVRRVTEVPAGMTASVVGSGPAARVRINRGTAAPGTRTVRAEMALGSVPYFTDAQIDVNLQGPLSTSDLSPENPFNYLSAHHRPLGADLQFGIPPSVKFDRIGAASAASDYTGGTNTRGRIAMVGAMVLAGEDKPVHVVTSSMKTGHWLKDADSTPTTGYNMPAPPATYDIKVPAPADVVPPYPTDGDAEVAFWPRDGGTVDMVDTFFHARYTGTRGDGSYDFLADKRSSWPLGGTDVPDGSPGDAGPSASRLRHPYGTVTGLECNAATPLIQHTMRLYCTRHSHKNTVGDPATVPADIARTVAASAPPEAHIMGDRAVWAAYGKDKWNPPFDDPTTTYCDNRGDIPYGTILTLKEADYNTLRATSGLNALQLAMIDAWYLYGGRVCDGHGDFVTNPTPADGRGPRLAVLRISTDGKISSANEAKLNEVLALIFPHLWPVKNPRYHFAESEVYSVVGSDFYGYPYCGGGGPRHPTKSINTAWDRPTVTPPPPPSGGVSIDNPFNFKSAHHRPIGAGVRFGIPPAVDYNDTRSVNTTSAYTGGNEGERGRIKNFGQMQFGADKPMYSVTASMTSRTISKTAESKPASGHNLPITIKIPDRTTVDPPYPTDHDGVIAFWPRNGGTADICDSFFQFRDSATHAYRASKVNSWPIAGMDAYDNGTGDPGASATKLRHPYGVVMGHELNGGSDGTPAIRHALRLFVTRHSHKNPGPVAPASTHLFNLKNVWPAHGKDGFSSVPGEDNQGDTPYGTLFTLKTADFNTLMARPGLTLAQKAMIECWYYYGGRAVDGHGDSIPNPTPSDGRGARLGTIRISDDGRIKNSVVSELNAIFPLILPLLWPVFNPRYHFRDTDELFNSPGNPGHGYYYVGGGGPRSATKSINTAYDRPTAAGI